MDTAPFKQAPSAMLYLGVLAMVAATSAITYVPRCPSVHGKSPFVYDKFAGDWYLAASNENTVQVKGRCAKLAFAKLTTDGYGNATAIARQTGINLAENVPMAYEDIFQFQTDEHVGLLYGVSGKEGTNLYTGIFTNAIVATDYSRYAVIVTCRSFFDGAAKQFRWYVLAEVWRREGVTLSQDTLEALVTVLSSYDVDPATIKPAESQCL